MLKNFTLSSDTLPPPNLPSSNDTVYFEMSCFSAFPTVFSFASFMVLDVLLVLPLCILILYCGLQQWWRNPSTCSAASMSHSDSFTYHTVALEVINFFGCIVFFRGISISRFDILSAGLLVFTFTSFGENFFHILTCVERYLAVIHPVTYLSLRRDRGIRIRHVSVGCVWLVCIGLMALMMGTGKLIVVNFCVLILSLTITSFCSLSVLCALTRPGPREQGGGRVKVDRSKRKGFYTIVSILGVLVLRFTCSLAWIVVLLANGSLNCALMATEVWFHLPSSMVLPLLFLHRKGKLSPFQTCRKPHGN